MWPRGYAVARGGWTSLRCARFAHLNPRAEGRASGGTPADYPTFCSINLNPRLAPSHAQVYVDELTEGTAARLPGAAPRAPQQEAQVRRRGRVVLRALLCAATGCVPTAAPLVAQDPEPMLGATARAWAVRRWNEVRVGLPPRLGVAHAYECADEGRCCTCGQCRCAPSRWLSCCLHCFLPAPYPQGVDRVFKPVVAALSSRNL